MEKNPIDVLLDFSDDSNIFLYDEKNNKVEFEQICLVPLQNEIYSILKPVEKLAGLNSDEALVFKIDKSDDEDFLTLVSDYKADLVFEEYYKLLKNENGGEK